MSLAIGRLTGSIISAGMFIKASPLPYRFRIRPVPGARAAGIRSPACRSSLLVFAIGYSDQLVAGSVLGTTALGFYVLAFNISSGRSASCPSRCGRSLPRPLRVFSTIRKRWWPRCAPRSARLRGSHAGVHQHRRCGRPHRASAVRIGLGGGRNGAAVVGAQRDLPDRFRALLRLHGGAAPVGVHHDRAGGLARRPDPGADPRATHFGLPGLAMAQVVVSVAVVLPMYLAGNRRVGLRVKDVLARTWPADPGRGRRRRGLLRDRRPCGQQPAGLPAQWRGRRVDHRCAPGGDRHSLRNLRNLSA